MPNSVASDVVTRARALLGTPWHHQGRLPGVGLDCIGIVVCIAHARGYFEFDDTNYGRNPTDDRLERYLDQFFLRQAGPPFSFPLAPGLVLLFEHPDTGRQHVAISTDAGMIHGESFFGKGKVVEQPLGEKWERAVKGVFAWAR